ncbi:unnamed protein product, partial [marine sediment metagenome]
MRQFFPIFFSSSSNPLLNRYIANHVPTKIKNGKEEIETFEDIAKCS